MNNLETLKTLINAKSRHMSQKEKLKLRFDFIRVYKAYKENNITLAYSLEQKLYNKLNNTNY